MYSLGSLSLQIRKDIDGDESRVKTYHYVGDHDKILAVIDWEKDLLDFGNEKERKAWVDKLYKEHPDMEIIAKASASNVPKKTTSHIELQSMNKEELEKFLQFKLPNK
jgi:hypothetical protein